MAAASRDIAFMSLSGELPTWLIGSRPRDHEPSDDRPPPPPPGVDPVRWCYADERKRKRMVREVRG